MDRIDDMLTRYFAAGDEPPRRTLRPSVDPAGLLAALADRIGIEAGSRGVRALTLAGDDEIAPGGRDYARRARREVMEFLAGRRTFFSVPVDLEGVGDFQARVLASAKTIPYGDVRSYAQLAVGIGAPRAARAVGNALAANPVPLIVPCHRVVRTDGSIGQYSLGGPENKRTILAAEGLDLESMQELASAGVRFIGNYAASGTTILEELGHEHVYAGNPILYTSADSVLQIAAHEEIVPPEKLYQICRIARRRFSGGRAHPGPRRSEMKPVLLPAIVAIAGCA